MSSEKIKLLLCIQKKNFKAKCFYCIRRGAKKHERERKNFISLNKKYIYGL